VNPGFDAHDVLTFHLALPDARYADPSAQSGFYTRALERIRALPGVEGAGAVTGLPTQGGSTQPIAIEGRPVVQMSDQPEVAVRVATPGYLETLRIPLVRGRELRPADGAGQPHAMLISESMARKFWPGEDPLGKHLTLTFSPDAPWEIVGIVGDVKVNEIAATTPTPALYVPHTQLPRQWMDVVVRAGRPLALLPSVAQTIRELDPELPLVDPKTLEAVVDESLAQARFAMTLLSTFAGFALLLAAIGIYSVLSYSVRRRMQEIGIRVALGARRWDILWLVVGHGLRLTLVGLVLGGVGALAVSRLIAGLLYGVAPTDPPTFLAVAALLTAIAILACYVPARRAMRVDPMVSMRSE
jgi:putative ABC transport system permease protein